MLYNLDRNYDIKRIDLYEMTTLSLIFGAYHPLAWRPDTPICAYWENIVETITHAIAELEHQFISGGLKRSVRYPSPRVAVEILSNLRLLKKIAQYHLDVLDVSKEEEERLPWWAERV